MKALLVCVIFAVHVSTLQVEIRNDVPRVDVQGKIIDCHSGNIVKHNGTFFLYGEHYGNSTGFGEKKWPRLHVYSSKDLVHWVHHGEMIKDAPGGTYFTPFVIFNNKTQEFVVWWNYYPDGCCNGNFGVAKSKDGLLFDIVGLNVSARYAKVDSNGLFVDDDGTAYIAYSSIAQDHHVSIEKLSDDYYSSTKENYGLFPDRYVEGPALWKRDGYYYISYGWCCCFCRAGSGVVVYKATSIQGPWARDGDDKNCKKAEPICNSAEDFNVNAQGIGLSKIPLANGTVVHLWAGERWLSAPHNNPNCPSECGPETGKCKEPKDYIKGHGYMYWIPLYFDVDGSVRKFEPFVDSFTLNL